jgi:hypothetical protein
MVKALKTIKFFQIYYEEMDEYYQMELEIDHENLDEESVAIEDSYGNEVDDELFDRICLIYENAVEFGQFNEEDE